MKKLKRTFAILRYFTPRILKAKPSFFVTLISRNIVLGVIPFINIIIPALIIDELLNACDLNRLLQYIIVYVVSNIVLGVIAEALKCLFEASSDYVKRVFDIELSHKAMTMDFQFTENKEALDELEQAQQTLSLYSVGITGIYIALGLVFSAVITLVGVTAIILYYVPLLFIVIVITVIISYVLNVLQAKVSYKHFGILSSINRRLGYIIFELCEKPYAEDIRLYDAKDIFLLKQEENALETCKYFKKTTREVLKLQQIDLVSGMFRNLASYLYVSYLTLKQVISIGSFTMLIASITSFSNSLTTIVREFASLLNNSVYFEVYIKFINKPDIMEKNHENVPDMTDYVIEFKNVDFCYPNSDVFVLKNINLTIKRGERISIVGLNGAGKTTFVKLLMRLYDVTSGEILLNGKNIKMFEYREYQKQFATVFQDFKIFAFSLRENIDFYHEYTDEEIIKMLDFVGFHDDFVKLPNGLETSLYKDFDETGVELSGGEAQKIAIARSIARKAQVLILDEPTAALDPIAEANVYKQFNELVDNRAAIFISHRLSSCKLSDWIVVFEGNTIKEKGSHQELFSNDKGIYHEMFNAQAQYYNE